MVCIHQAKGAQASSRTEKVLEWWRCLCNHQHTNAPFPEAKGFWTILFHAHSLFANIFTCPIPLWTWSVIVVQKRNHRIKVKFETETSRISSLKKTNKPREQHQQGSKMFTWKKDRFFSPTKRRKGKSMTRMEWRVIGNIFHSRIPFRMPCRWNLQYFCEAVTAASSLQNGMEFEQGEHWIHWNQCSGMWVCSSSSSVVISSSLFEVKTLSHRHKTRLGRRRGWVSMNFHIGFSPPKRTRTQTHTHFDWNVGCGKFWHSFFNSHNTHAFLEFVFFCFCCWRKPKQNQGKSRGSIPTHRIHSMLAGWLAEWMEKCKEFSWTSQSLPPPLRTKAQAWARRHHKSNLAQTIVELDHNGS